MSAHSQGRTFEEACRSLEASWSLSGPCERAVLCKAWPVWQTKARLCSLSASRACGQAATLATLEHAKEPAEQKQQNAQTRPHKLVVILVSGPVVHHPHPKALLFKKKKNSSSVLSLFIYIVQNVFDSATFHCYCAEGSHFLLHNNETNNQTINQAMYFIYY